MKVSIELGDLIAMSNGNKARGDLKRMTVSRDEWRRTATDHATEIGRLMAEIRALKAEIDRYSENAKFVEKLIAEQAERIKIQSIGGGKPPRSMYLDNLGREIQTKGLG